MPTSFKSKITDSCLFYLRTFGTWLKNPEIPEILDTLESGHQIGSKAAVTLKACDFQKLEIKSSLLSGRWLIGSECLWLPFSDREVLHNAVRFCQVRRRKVSTDSSHKKWSFRFEDWDVRWRMLVQRFLRCGINEDKNVRWQQQNGQNQWAAVQWAVFLLFILPKEGGLPMRTEHTGPLTRHD